MTLKKLNRQTVFTEDRPVKVLQFGEGNFLRAFADWMIDVLNERTDFDGNIQIVQPRAHSAHKGKLVNDQDGLYHVVIKGIRAGKPVEETRLITCVKEVINAYENYSQFLRTAENPAMEFVISNTTEAGICFKDEDHDVSAVAETFPGKLTAWLHHRYQFFKGDPAKGVILLPCELLEKNGESLKEAVLQYILHWKLSNDFLLWVLRHNTFCNTLVDRIVPGFPKDDIDKIEKETGFEDKLTVMAEPFYVWVIEGGEKLKMRFPTQQAELNVKFVDNLLGYRTQKVRILNGAHTVMVPVGYLKGLRTVKEVIQDPEMSAFVTDAIQEEIIPSLDMPDEDLQQFASDVMDRFANPFVRHELASIALNSISKFKVRVLPSILEYHQRKGKLPQRLVRSLASLIRFYKGEWRGESLPINDDAATVLFFQEIWKANDVQSVVKGVLQNEKLWGQDLTPITGLTALVATFLEELVHLEATEQSVGH